MHELEAISKKSRPEFEKSFWVKLKYKKNKQIKITIENDFDPEAITQKGTGTGMKNIKERLKIIYQLNDLFSFEKSEKSYKVVLVIPHKQVFKKIQPN